MKKIPTVFRRNPDDLRHVLPEVSPGCEWVVAGEAVPRRKYDGTCLMLDEDGGWWARREVKPGKTPPPHFVPVDHDETTGKTVGWEPIEQTGWVRSHAEAARGDEAPGTFELCGPKVNGNPERLDRYLLFRHEHAEIAWAAGQPLDFELLRDTLLDLGEAGWEGVVFHNPDDGHMAKLKARDFQ